MYIQRRFMIFYSAVILYTLSKPLCLLFFLCVHVYVFLHHNDFSLIVQCPQIFTKHVCDKFARFRKPFHRFPEASQESKLALG